MYSKTTGHIHVQVEPAYLDEKSAPADNHYVWAYTILIENRGVAEVQLRSRYWHITDARGKVQEVRGEGVIGEQPTLRAGETFRYTSGVVLNTPSGIMTGHYTFENAQSGGHFDVAVPAFSLDCPYQVMRQH
ncbi:MAG: Co2+/Mg2+ efflux protein ApaG [Alphaproteobacteria bacterium]|nr:Co2+/Mg2+ efflux protein ApaG [Alphaproteobacteria bacterium]